MIQVTDACPYLCPQCYVTRGHTDIPLSYAERVIDGFLRNRAGLVQLTGGEPLLYSGLFELIPFCSRRGIFTTVATSGKGFRREHLSLFRENGVMVHASLNGSTKEIHQITRNGYEDTVKLIHLLKSEGIGCSVNWVASQSNADDLPRLREQCAAWGVNRIHILRKMPNYRGELTDIPTPTQLENIQRWVDETQDFLCPEGCFYELCRTKECDAGNTTFYVSCDGTISPCSALRRFQYSSITELQEHSAEWRQCICKKESI